MRNIIRRQLRKLGLKPMGYQETFNGEKFFKWSGPAGVAYLSNNELLSSVPGLMPQKF